MTELRQLRQACGLSAVWCAQHIGKCSIRKWSEYEKGERHGRALKINEDWLWQLRDIKLALARVVQVPNVPPDRPTSPTL